MVAPSALNPSVEFSMVEQEVVETCDRKLVPKSRYRWNEASTLATGANFELSVKYPANLGNDTLDVLHKLFDEAHEQAYGYHWPKRDLELVTFRVTASIEVDRPLPVASKSTGSLSSNPKAHRPVYFESVEAFANCPIFDRATLSPDQRLLGPAIFEQIDTTTVVPPGFMASVDHHRNLRIDHVADQLG
jgi:N-methylhydantoinase A